jgi:hypothetical protein
MEERIRDFENCSGCKKDSDTGTRTLVSCVKGKYANHLHHIGAPVCGSMTASKIYKL